MGVNLLSVQVDVLTSTTTEIDTPQVVYVAIFVVDLELGVNRSLCSSGMCERMCVCTCVYTYVCTYVCMCMCTCVCTCVYTLYDMYVHSVCVCMYVCV